MQQFIDKLISRLGEESNKWLDIWADASRRGVTDNYADGMNDAFDEAISIVNQLAEEYKKEWSKDYGWKLTKRFIEEKYFKRIYEISEKYDYPCENIALDMNWMFGLIEKIENKFTEEYKPRTNAERIRSMSDSEMARDLLPMIEEVCEDGVPCEMWFLEWLQSDFEEE